MKSRKKYKLKIKGPIIIIILILGLLIFIFSTGDRKQYMNDLSGLNYNELIDNLKKTGLSISTIYEYNDNVSKDMIISQSITSGSEINEGDELVLTISKGKLDKEKMKNDGINELGKVPIMMYHGIKNIKSSEAGNTGGNVDKDGYTRTTEAFREDLEFYYENGYRMIKLSDYVNGKIDVPYGYSPIILTFDDGNANNIKVTGEDSNGNIIIDPASAVGVLEEFKKNHPDANVTAIFFITSNLFNQSSYDIKIINWLIDTGYEIGNHTWGHNNFSNINASKSEEVVAKMYNKLDEIIPGKYQKIVALPYGSPYSKTHDNYSHILSATYNGTTYDTVAALRVGWEPEVSPFNKNFDATFLKRCRAYDNNGKEFDIQMVFNMLKKTRYISDGNIDTIVTDSSNESLITNSDKEIILY